MPPRPQPDVAIILPSYNAEKTLPAAVQSLLQGAEPVHVLVVDDGSRIPVSQVLNPLPDNVEILRFEKNVGLISGLNAGLEHLLKAGFAFIGRMDSDDISLPNRLSTQKKALLEHPDWLGCGGWANMVDESTGQTLYRFTGPTTPEDFNRGMFSNSMALHPTWLIRADAWRKIGSYSKEFPYAEDYEWLQRAIKCGKFVNIPEIILNYTLSSGGISRKKRHLQLAVRLKIQWKYRNLKKMTCWKGLLKTLVLMILPMPLVEYLKKT